MPLRAGPLSLLCLLQGCQRHMTMDHAAVAGVGIQTQIKPILHNLLWSDIWSQKLAK